MRQSGHWSGSAALDLQALVALLDTRIQQIDIGAVQREVRPFLRDPRDIDVWSREFIHAAARRLTT